MAKKSIYSVLPWAGSAALVPGSSRTYWYNRVLLAVQKRSDSEACWLLASMWKYTYLLTYSLTISLDFWWFPIVLSTLFLLSRQLFVSNNQQIKFTVWILPLLHGTQWPYCGDTIGRSAVCRPRATVGEWEMSTLMLSRFNSFESWNV